MSGDANLVINWQSVAGKYYRIMAATNIGEGFKEILRNNLVATPAMNTATVNMGQTGCKYYRVNLE
jgi:hypothetical protein